MSFVPLSCSFVSQVPPLPAFRGNGCFHDAKIICPDLLSVTPITVHATILPCARRVRFRPAFVSRLSPLPCFILPLSGGRRRISGCRIGGCIVLFRFISMRNSKKDGTAESVLRSGLKSVLNRLVYAGFGLPESI